MNVIAHIHLQQAHEILFKTEAARFLLAGFLKKIAQCSFIDDTHVWTVPVLKKPVTALVTGQHIREINLEEAYYRSGFPDADRFRDCIDAQLLREKKKAGDIFLYIDPAYLLFSIQNLENMFDQLLEDDQSHVIYPVYKVDPHIYMKRYNCEEFYPVWEYAGLDRQKYPQLYRKIAIYIFHFGRPRYKQPVREGVYPIAWTEGKRCITDQWLAFATHVCLKQKTAPGHDPQN